MMSAAWLLVNVWCGAYRPWSTCTAYVAGGSGMPDWGNARSFVGHQRLCSLTLRRKLAQKPCIVWSLVPKALKHESLEP